MTRPLLTGLTLLALLLSASCGKGKVPAAGAGEVDVKAFVSLERVEVRSGPAPDARRAGALVRGTEVLLKGYTAGFGRVLLPSGSEGWIPAGSFERLTDRQARLARTDQVAKFAPQIGKVQEPIPFFLAPDFGAAQYGDCEEGAGLNVLLADHDFYGVLLPGKILAFVPARGVRLVPEPPADQAPPAAQAAVMPSGGASGHAPGAEVARSPAFSGAPTASEPVHAGPYESLPADAEAPVLVTRIDPRYPDFARKAGMSGDVQLKVLVDAEGRVTRVDVVTGAPGGMTEAATDAVRRWVYQPAKIGGRPVSVWKVVRVHFAIEGKATRSDEPPPL